MNHPLQSNQFTQKINIANIAKQVLAATTLAIAVRLLEKRIYKFLGWK